MDTQKAQSFRKHASLDPAYHGVIAVGLLFELVLAVVLLVMHLRTDFLLYLWILAASLVMTVVALKLRLYPLKVQDRVIRLEERLRMAMILPESLCTRIHELTEDQLVGLRFASDQELPTLVAMTLEKHLNRKQIKERIESWRPDYFRI